MALSRRCVALLTGLASISVSLACTAIGVGKDASSSGSPMVGHSEDAGPSANDVRLVRVPRRRWAPGSRRPLYRWLAPYPRVVSADQSPEYAPVNGQNDSVPLAHIPQVAETWAYWDTDYAVQNEWGVSIGESTCTARTVGWPSDRPWGYNNAGIEDLTKLAMERCTTARCAVQLMGSIAVEQGFYSADSGAPEAPAYSGSSECLVVGDAAPGEIWVFNLMTGKNNASAIWAAQRFPSDHVVAVGNSFTIRKMNLSDSDNFLYSPGVSILAEEMGWWSPEDEASPGVFDFFGAYGWTPTAATVPPQFSVEVLTSTLSYYSSRRMWRIFSLLSPAEGAKLDRTKGNLPRTTDPYPSSVRAPRGSVTPAMVMDVYRDHYEGTPYDLTQGMAAGPFGNPNRGIPPKGLPGQWERAISMYRTTWSFVLEARPRARSITWFGWDAPHGTVYLPFYGAAAAGGPESYHSHEGHMSNFSTKVAWWAFNLVNQYQDLNFRAINADVRKKAGAIEAEAFRAVAAWEAEADGMAASGHGGQEEAIRLLTSRSNAFAQHVVAEWWSFAWSLIVKFRGYVVTNNESENGVNPLGQVYPEWWLQSPEVGFTTWSSTGPYHGLLLSADASPASGTQQARLAQEPEGARERRTAFTAAAVLCALVPSAVAAAVAHQVGFRRGQRSIDLEDSYMRVAA